jgi:hypothetical protein
MGLKEPAQYPKWLRYRMRIALSGLLGLYLLPPISGVAAEQKEDAAYSARLLN